MEKYLYIKSKLLRKRMMASDKAVKKEMQEWWKKVLPRGGSLLRHLVDKELSSQSK